MSLKDLRDNWDEFAKADPLWAILTVPKKEGGKWNVDEFFQTGREEIDELIQYIRSLGISTPHRRALDFGCGIGRVTQALASHFDDVHGVDIAPSMIELANSHNRYVGKCNYHLNYSDRLAMFPDCTFDLVYSNIALHICDRRTPVGISRNF